MVLVVSTTMFSEKVVSDGLKAEVLREESPPKSTATTANAPMV